MNNSTRELMFSSNSNEWGTPQLFFDKLNDKFGFTLDPCATKKNAKCKKFFTTKDDGLSKSWEGEIVFVNPPYGRKDLKQWVEKSYKESRKENTIVVLLCPARTDTKYFHNYIMKASELHFVKGRLKFENSNKNSNSAPFPSVVAVFKKDATPVLNSL